jgi:hypothetical protein
MTMPSTHQNPSRNPRGPANSTNTAATRTHAGPKPCSHGFPRHRRVVAQSFTAGSKPQLGLQPASNGLDQKGLQPRPALERITNDLPNVSLCPPASRETWLISCCRNGPTDSNKNTYAQPAPSVSPSKKSQIAVVVGHFGTFWDRLTSLTNNMGQENTKRTYDSPTDSNKIT